MRKVLFPEWDSYGQNFVIAALEAEGFEVVLYTIPRAEADAAKREKLANDLVHMILAGAYEFVFSVNYLPIVAIACKGCRVKYISWVYDSPSVELYSETVAYETNYIFIFDRKNCLELWKKGVETVYYLPLAADVSFYDSVIRKNVSREQYQSEISFVGSLYTEPFRQFWPLEAATEYLKGYLDGLINAQIGVYGVNFLEAVLQPEIVNKMQSLCRIPQRVNSSETLEWIYANYYLSRMVTGRERTQIMTLLAERFLLKLYTSDSVVPPRVQNMGQVDYYQQAPLVFSSSQINLNITLRSIHSGMPLRAFDIMGCGGFLLSNFQQDFLDFFIPGEDFVYYESHEDLVNKTAYYLEHAGECARIAQNGYEKVKQGHTYAHRIREILDIVP